jgi:hypothetical protein
LDFVKKQADPVITPKGMLDPSLLTLIEIDTAGNRNLLSHKLLYVPDEFIPIKPEQNSIPAGLEEGQRLEYINIMYVILLVVKQLFPIRCL